MAVKPVPEGYHTVTPCLVVRGAARLVEFLKEAFGAEVLHPPALGPDGAVLHAEMKVGDSIILLGESSEKFPAMTASLYLYVEDTDLLYRRAVKAGAAPVAEPSDQFYGDRNAGVKDFAGNLWWIATHQEDVPPEEMKRRMKALHMG